MTTPEEAAPKPNVRRKPLDYWRWFVRFLVWLTGKAWRVWLALVVPLLPTWFFVGQGVDAVRLWGLALQIAGLVVVAIGLLKMPKEFDQPTLWRHFLDWLKAFPSFGRVKDAAVHMGGIGGQWEVGEPQIKIGKPPNATLEQRLDRVEELVDRVQDDLHATKGRIAAFSKEVAKQFEQEQRQRERADIANDEKTMRAVVGHLHWEVLGVVWVFIGLVLATAPLEVVTWLAQSALPSK